MGRYGGRNAWVEESNDFLNEDFTLKREVCCNVAVGNHQGHRVIRRLRLESVVVEVLKKNLATCIG